MIWLILFCVVLLTISVIILKVEMNTRYIEIAELLREIIVVDALPGADSTTRYSLYGLTGAAGVRDRLYYGIKHSDNNYYIEPMVVGGVFHDSETYPLKIENDAGTEHGLIWRDGTDLHVDSGTGGNLNLEVAAASKIVITTTEVRFGVDAWMRSGERILFYNVGNSEFGSIYRDSDYLYVVGGAGGVINLGNGSGTNFTKVEADGTLEFNGTATVFTDIFFPMSIGKVGGANQPSWDAFQGNTKEYTFAINDYIDLPTQEISHSYKEGSDISLHVHIVLDGSDVGATVVNYEIEYTIGDIDEVMGAATVVTSGDVQIPGGTADRTHLYYEVDVIAGANLKMAAALKVRFRRVALVGGGNAPSSDPFVLMVGAHIQMDTVGSRTETAK